MARFFPSHPQPVQAGPMARVSGSTSHSSRGPSFSVGGTWLDRAITVVSPKLGLRRAQYRRAVAKYYDAVEQTRLRTLRLSNPSGDGATYGNTINLRAVARDMERNHDLADGVIRVLVQNTVGVGIGIEPQPKMLDGTLASELAQSIRARFRDWMRRPEVTRELDWGMAQRLAARRWFVDGEMLVQHVSGSVAGIQHPSRVPYSFEIMEADQLADWITDPARGISQGVQRDSWGRPIAYWIYRGNPGDMFISPLSLEAKAVNADRIEHLKTVTRIRQARGVSVFAGVITRLRDLKDYEESERIAAKIAASLAVMITRGGPDAWNSPGVADPTDPETGARELKFSPGMSFNDLLPGEDVKMIDPTRPNVALGEHRNGQLRAVAAGTGSGYSSISKNYNGTYSAQRQELVEQWGAYSVLSTHFTAKFVEPIYRRWMQLAVASGALTLPAGIDMSTLSSALFLAPQMPWIDPLKEAMANTMMEVSGYASAPEIIRRRGQNPDDVLDQEAEWKKRREEKGLVMPPEQINIKAQHRGIHPIAAVTYNFEDSE